jgi:hypothetical protein
MNLRRLLTPALLVIGLLAATPGDASAPPGPIVPKIVIKSASGANGKVTFAGKIVPKAAAKKYFSQAAFMGIQRCTKKGVTTSILGFSEDLKGTSGKFRISRPDNPGTHYYCLSFTPGDSTYAPVKVIRKLKVVKPRKKH